MPNLTSRAAAAAAAGVIVLVALLYAAAQLILLPSYVDLERRQITEHVGRARDALLAEINDLDHQLGDWAAWDETYDYVARPSADYVKRNIPEGTFADLRLSALAILDKTGTVLYAQGFDLPTERPAKLSAPFRAMLQPPSPLARHGAVDSSIKGLLPLREGPMLVASRPVLTGDRTGPIRGAMVWGRYLDAHEVSRLADVTHLSLTAKAVHADVSAPSSPAEPASLPVAVLVRDDGTVSGTTVLADIFGHPALELSVVEPRTVVEQGRSNIRYFLGWFAVFGFGFGLVMVSLYDRLVTSRYERRTTEERYRALVDQASPLAIMAADRTGLLKAWNPAAERLFGWSARDVLGKPPPVLREDSRDAYEALRAQITTAGSSGVIEITLSRRDGTPIPAEVSAAALRGPDGTIEGTMAVVTDLTARQEAAAHIERQLQRLAALRMIDSAITASLELKVTLDVLLDQVTTQLGVDAANVLLFDPQLQRLNYGAGRGFRTGALQYTNLRLGEGHAGVAALERRLVHVPDLRVDPGTLARAPQLANEGFVSYFAVPLIAKGEMQGVLGVFHREALQPDDEWIRFLESLAGQAAIAIDNSRLFENLQRASSELSLAYDATLEGWSRALDLRDHETEGHTQRVAELTLRLAQEMGVGGDDLVHIRRGALLHDIGKMGIPDSILLKPDRLTDEERTIIEHHPTYAYALLSPIPFLRKALDIPHCHHEKWDGSGYPRGLRGESIPVAARIFAVVDVWDALTSHRPYRAAWPAAKALAYIKEQSGKHFDPAVADAFVRLLAVLGTSPGAAASAQS